MKALILSGGMGTRLRPLTHAMPKQLIPLANKPVLFHGLEAVRDAGITEAGIVVGDWQKEIRQAVGDGSRFGLRIEWIHQEAPFGLAHCVLIAREFLGDDDFTMYLGDNVFGDGITVAADRFRRARPAAQVAVAPVDNPQEYGIVETGPDGRVHALREKPRRPRSNLAVTGAYFFTPLVHEAVRAIEPSARGEREITDALQWLVDQGHDVRATEVTGWWKDTGRIDDILDGNRLLLDGIEARVEGSVDAASTALGPVVVAPGARVVRSHLRGPLVVGEDCVVEDSYLGPHTSVGAGCRVSEAGISDSILLDHAAVRDVNGIHGSVIGRSARVGTTPAGAARHRIVVGDHTEVDVVA
ncbi:glucose-1-phosphate thymidylyltransferase [Streptomyces sp. RG38]|uniref:Glucose-1-phosphate thymidylyltransferase n=1 Tax=Streptomyces tagetis TaxID=2820809 RepID=A0A940XCU0_9ACTN|nr:glucose-1-phosphate thymidylyltransferase [Streptomyces sp. RG38]MBQ0825052.1 glucose-1-phosphate thymidylyltransferase [Streptomyces sp. RG38]